MLPELSGALLFGVLQSWVYKSKKPQILGGKLSPGLLCGLAVVLPQISHGEEETSMEELLLSD